MKKIGFFQKISVKMISSFLVLVILIVALGVISYNMAYLSIQSNYEDSTKETIEAMAMYGDLLLREVSSKAEDIAKNDDLIDYYASLGQLSEEESEQIKSDLQKTFIKAIAAIDSIYHFYIISEYGHNLSSEGVLNEDAYHRYMESEDGKIWETNTAMDEMWTGYHKWIDQETESKTDPYAVTLSRKLYRGKGFVMVDVKTDALKDVLNRLSGSTGAIKSFVSPDGRETTLEDGVLKEKDVMANLPFFKASKEGEAASGLSYETYQGKKYLYAYSKIGGTGSMFCLLIPESDFMEHVKNIKMLTLIIVIAACLITIAIGTVLAGGIGRTVKDMASSLSKVSSGDLTTEFHTKSKDEFGVLTKGLEDSFTNIRRVLGEVSDFSKKVVLASNDVSNVSEHILETTREIADSVEAVEQGVMSQASDAEMILTQMNRFSNKINNNCKSVDDMNLVAGSTKSIVGDGMVIIDKLQEKSSDTTKMTKIIIGEIEELEAESASIESFVGVINEIAEQTNLLSLNASIEAAKAGDVGRGFAVVADEIRKLAEQSVGAVEQIREIVENIQSRTKVTAGSAKKAEEMLGTQSEALDETIQLFHKINQYVEKLLSNLQSVLENTEEIKDSKNEVLSAIENISSISEETAASSAEVTSTVTSQVDSIANLSGEAESLAVNARRLEDVIRRFKI